MSDQNTPPDTLYSFTPAWKLDDAQRQLKIAQLQIDALKAKVRWLEHKLKVAEDNQRSGLSR